METVQRIVIVTVMGKCLEPGGEASEELVDRCRTAARVMGEVEGAMVIPTGGDPAQVGITEAEVMRGLMMEMGIQPDKIVAETEAQTTVQNAIFVLKMIKEKLEAEQTKAKLIIVTSAYHLPFTSWLFRQVAAALKMEIQMESVAATGAGAYEPSMMRLCSNLAKTAISDMRYGLRNELQRAGITLGDDFKFENIDDVVQETLSLSEEKLEL